MSRIRRNFVTGTLGQPLTSSGTQINFTVAPTALPNIGSPDYAAIIINPTPYGATTSGSEIVYLTAFSGGTQGTVTRAREGTSALAWASGTTWSVGVLSSDFTLTNGMNNGDFPTPTASNQLFVSTASGAVNPSWSTTVSGLNINSSTASGLTITGSTFAGGQIGPTTITGGSFNGGGILTSTIYSGNTFNAGSVPTSALTGSLNATTVTGTLSTNTRASNVFNANDTTLTVSGYNSYLIHCSRTYYSANTAGQAVQTLAVNSISRHQASQYITVNGDSPVITVYNFYAYAAPSTGAVSISFTVATAGTGIATGLSTSNAYISAIGVN